MEDIDDLLTKPGQGGKNSYMDDSGNPFTDEEAETKPPRGDGSAYQTKIKVGDVLINRYTVLSELGFGGMGIVYQKWNERIVKLFFAENLFSFFRFFSK